MSLVHTYLDLRIILLVLILIENKVRYGKVILEHVDRHKIYPYIPVRTMPSAICKQGHKIHTLRMS